MGIVKEIIGFIFRFSGIPFLIREILCKNKATIILYHNPKAEIFKKHIDYLSKYYNFISLDRLIDAIYNKDWSDISPKSLVITIDDGDKKNYMLLDIFKTYNIRPTIYLCSHIVNTNRKFWFGAGFPNNQELKRYNDKKRLGILKERTGYEPQKEYATRQALNLEEIKEMSGYVDFQSHSKFHTILTSCSEGESKREIGESKDYLEKLLNKKIEHFGYPNGDYTGREVEHLKNCGYKSARTLDIGWNRSKTDPFRLKAMCVQDDVSVNILCAQICGFFGYLRYFRHGSFNGKHPPHL